jgi:uncharacterized membrane protein YkvA (DUF1232 family)
MMMKKLRYLKYTFRYLLDQRIPFYKKLWIYLVLFYFLSPFDIIPDPILGLGWFDDVVILILAVMKLVDVLEKYAGNNERSGQSKDGATIENVEYKVHKE